MIIAFVFLFIFFLTLLSLLLQFEISAMEKSAYTDPGEEQKIVRMAVKLVESNN